jgi:uncharacterized lipoprotein YbaY/heat shock protein HslJ
MIHKYSIKTLFSITLFSVLTVLAASFSASAQQSRANGSWLDRPLVNWNRAASGFPQLPRPVAVGGAASDSRCFEQIRQPETAAERALTQRGWRLYGATQSFGQTKIVSALSGFDGMCRPLGFQAFVYWEGRYAGTLAPAAMDSRADGALTDFRLISPTNISAEFARYASSDALCCPSKISRVNYTLRRDDVPNTAPVSVMTDAACQTTGQTESPSGGSNADALAGRRWVLTDIGNQRVSADKPFIEFNNQERRVSGDAGCNLFSGGYETSGARLKFTNVAGTLRACIDARANRLETRFLQTLSRVNEFTVTGDTLRLYANNRRANPLLVFRASADTSQQQTASVTGTISYLQRIALPPNAVIKVELLDLSRVGAAQVIAEQTINANGRQVPFDFELRYDPNNINSRSRYVVRAQIYENGRMRFNTTRDYLVITNGNPSRAAIIVTMVR